jgi:hypothetical protein
MRGLRTSVALAALLAATGGALAQGPVATGQPVFTLTGTGGLNIAGVPAFDTGFFGHQASGALIGGMFGISGSGSVATFDDVSVILGVNAYVGFAGGQTSWTDTFSGDGTVVITGLTIPGGAAAMNLNPGGSPDVTVNGVISAVGTIDAGGGTINAGFVAPDDGGAGPGFIGGVYAEGAGGTMSGGFIADTSGGVGAVAGNLDGLSITTTTNRSLTIGGADFTAGLAGNISDTVALQVYAGPSIRGTSGSETTKVTIDYFEQQPSATTFPEFSITQTDILTGTYLGGLAGLSAAIVQSPGVIFNLGVEAGLYSVNASWKGNNTYSTCCGNFAPLNGSPVEGPSPSLSVSSDPLTYDFASAVAVNAKANAGVTLAIDDNKAITFGGNVEYLSHVAQVSHPSQTTYTPGSTDVTGFAAPAPSTFSWGSMISLGGTISVTGSF